MPWAALAALLLGSGAAARPTAPALLIGQPIQDIIFESHNVFDQDKPEEARRIFKLANSIHVLTHKKVIKRELLFSVGDLYDPELLRETERNLRRLSFIRKAEVAGVYGSSGPVVIVRTWDAWTLELNASYKRAGGVTDTRLGAADRNLLGYGKTASLLYTGTGQDADRSVLYHDPQFFGKRLAYSVSAGKTATTQHYGTSLGRPFYATIARSSFIGGINYNVDQPGVYRNLAPAGTVGRRSYDANLTYGYALEASPLRTRRLSLGLLHQRADYSLLADQPTLFVPDADQHTSLVLGAEYQDNFFIKQRRIQKLSRDEDFNMGLGLSPSIAYAPRLAALGTTGELITPKLELRKGISSELGQFLILRGDYLSQYVNGGNGGRVATVDAQYFCRYFPRHTVAAHVAFDHGYRLAPQSLLSLGEDNGLRGYRSKQFQGNRRLLFNAEERVFFFEDIWKIIDGGGVVFFDTGYAWMPEQAFRFADLKSSYGFGLRIGATRSASNDPLRIDIAHALNDNLSPSRWTLSIQAGHSFGPN